MIRLKSVSSQWYCLFYRPALISSVFSSVTGTALVLLFIFTGTVGTVGTLVPATLCLCTNMLLVLHWYCSLYVLVLWVLLVHCTCHSMSLYQYVTGTALVLLFICTGTVGTVGTLVPAILCLCTNMLLVLHWYCSLYVLVLWVLLVHWYQLLYVSVPICYWYCTGTALYMYWYCGYCWYIGTSHTICLYQYVTGTTVYMYWCCGYCCYTGTSHFMSLYQYVTGTALVLLFICIGTVGTVGTVGTLVPAILCLCTNMLLVLPLVLLFICTGTVGTVGTLAPATLCLCTNMLLVLHRYCTGIAVYMYWYCGYCWYTGTSHSMCLYQYVTGTVLVLLFICTGTVGTVGTVGTLVSATLCLCAYMLLVPPTLCLCAYMLLVLHWYCCLYVLVLWLLLVHAGTCLHAYMLLGSRTITPRTITPRTITPRQLPPDNNPPRTNTPQTITPPDNRISKT